MNDYWTLMAEVRSGLIIVQRGAALTWPAGGGVTQL